MKTEPCILRIWGISDASPLDVSNTLSELRVSHARYVSPHTPVAPVLNNFFQESHVSTVGTSGVVRVDLGYTQPALPVILDSVNQVGRFTLESDLPLIVFLCQSKAVLQHCNIRRLKCDDLNRTLRRALPYSVKNPEPDFVFSYKEPSIEEYVNVATKPSFLNFINTGIYRITPYALRKEVQALIIKFLNGDVGVKPVKSKLSSSHKLSELHELLSSARALDLRNAVAEYKKSMTPENLSAVCKSYNFDSFEIMFVVKSGGK